jgi:TetR/AcrR family transcriptional regulator, transcriptional repressor for nem operon
MGGYLSCRHHEGGSETPRQSPEVVRVATRHIKEMIDLVARQSPDWGQPRAHECALLTVATMVGTLLLARVVASPRYRKHVRGHLEAPGHRLSH